MQAYKQLYEDQLQTQQIAAESYRSLTRGYSRLSADNKALRKETGSVTVAAAPTVAAVVEPTDMNTRAKPQTKTTRETLVRGRVDTVGENAAQRTGATITSVPSSSVGGAGDAGTQHAAAAAAAVTASESAAAVATAAAAVAAAAGALAVATASSPNDDDNNTEQNAEQHQRRRGDNAEREKKGPGCVGKSRTSPTDSASTAETLACSPSFGAEEGEESETALAAAAACKRHLADGDEAEAAARYRARLAPSSTVVGDGTIREEDVFSATAADDDDSVAIARGGGDRGRSFTSTEAYAFPRTGGSSAPSTSQTPHSTDDDDWERSAAQSPGEKPLFVAVPPVDRDPRWRGRTNVGPGRAVASSASWAEAVDVPKRSSSPTPPRCGRWGACGGGGRGWRTEILGEDGCTRIEPSRARPHSI